MVVQPDRPDNPVTRPGSKGTAAVILAGGALLAGFLALGLLGTPAGSEEAAATSTTTTIPLGEPFLIEEFSVSDIEVGLGFEWAQIAIDAHGAPLALVAHNGAVYLFETGALDFPEAGAWSPGYHVTAPAGRAWGR